MKRIIIFLLLICSSPCIAQNSTLVLSYDMFNDLGAISLGDKETWLFKAGRDSTYNQDNASTWTKLKPSEMTKKLADENGKFEGWFRIKIKLDKTFKNSLAGLNFSHESWTPTDLFINGNLVKSYGQTGLDGAEFKTYKYRNKAYYFVNLETDKTYNILLFVSDKTDVFGGELKSSRDDLSKFIVLGNSQIVLEHVNWYGLIFFTTLFGALTLLFWALYFQNKREKQLFYPTITITLLFLSNGFLSLTNLWTSIPYVVSVHMFSIFSTFFTAFIFSIPLTLAIIFKNTIPKTIWIASSVIFTLTLILTLFTDDAQVTLIFGYIYVLVVLAYYLFRSWKTLQGPKRAFVIGIGILLVLVLVSISLIVLVGEGANAIVGFILPLAFISFPISLFVYILLWLKESRKEKEKNVDDLIKITQEKKDLLENQNEVLEQQVNERTTELNQSLQHLKATQTQLIQSEKMASLGELTAGIAHEIQNPLNFVNNFSEVSNEMIQEIKEERKKDKEQRDEVLENELLEDISRNLGKINHHGKRADAIVKGMLQHSRSSSGKKEMTDLNALCDEYLRLSYHGLRAKDNTFNATIKTDFDDAIGQINIIPQDFGRVILNLINNAFYAVNQKKQLNIEGYEPTVSISTKKEEGKVIVTVNDNGNGMPKEIMDKVFQPFFTTKPTGQGTGLGLSLAYDIVTKGHEGDLTVESEEGIGTIFNIKISV